MDSKEKRKLLVIGIGNNAMADDGIGIRIVEELKKRKLNSGRNVQILVLGPDPLKVLLVGQDAGYTIFIDAVCLHSKGRPGEVKTFQKIPLRDILKMYKKGSHGSLHQFGLLETLKLADALGYSVEGELFGIESEGIYPGEELSKDLEKRLPAIIDEIENEIVSTYDRLCLNSTCGSGHPGIETLGEGG